MRTKAVVPRVLLAVVLCAVPVVALAGPATAADAVDDTYVVNEDAPSDGTVADQPNADVDGADTFTDVAGDVLTTSTPVRVPVAVADTAPVAAPDSYVLDEDTTLSAVSVLGNDTDLDADPLTAVLVTGPGAGSLSLAADGTFVYSPDANVNGADSFTYQASDGTDVSAATTVTLTIDPVPDPPTFAVPALAAVIIEDTTYTGLATALNPDGLPLFYTITAPGTAVIDPVTGAYTVTPPADFFGVAPVEVVACDTLGRCARQAISLTVMDVPDALVAHDMDVTLFAGPEVTALFDVANPGGAVLAFRALVAPGQGVVAITSSTQSFVYTSSPGASGDDSFVYEVCDPSGLCDTATVTIRPYAGGLPIRPSIGFLVCQSSATTPEAEAACGPFIDCIFRVSTSVERIACYQAAFGALAGPGAQVTTAALVSAGGQTRRDASGHGAGDMLAVTGGDVGSLALGALAVVGCGSLLVAHSSRKRGRP